jgi:hypothetical protein
MPCLRHRSRLSVKCKAEDGRGSQLGVLLDGHPRQAEVVCDLVLAGASTQAMDQFAKIMHVQSLHSGASGKALPKGWRAAAAGRSLAYTSRRNVACRGRR